MIGIQEELIKWNNLLLLHPTVFLKNWEKQFYDLINFLEKFKKLPQDGILFIFYDFNKRLYYNETMITMHRIIWKRFKIHFQEIFYPEFFQKQLTFLEDFISTNNRLPNIEFQKEKKLYKFMIILKEKKKFQLKNYFL